MAVEVGVLEGWDLILDGHIIVLNHKLLCWAQALQRPVYGLLLLIGDITVINV